MAPSLRLVDIEPRVRIVGSLLGQSRSRRRGSSRDIVGSRLYVPGDDIRVIDWPASARLSSATGEERFVVREFYAEEAPTVVLAVDCSPTMTLYPQSLPWLHKPSAVTLVLDAVAQSAARHHSLITCVTSASETMEPPRSTAETDVNLEAVAAQGIRASAHWLVRLLVEGHRWLPPGTLVFVLSDFHEGVDDELVRGALDFEWDLVPVVLSDPRWERTFPEVVGGMTLPVADESGRLRPRRVSSRAAAALRAHNEHASRMLLSGFRDAGFPPVLVNAANPDAVTAAFVDWSLEREGIV